MPTSLYPTNLAAVSATNLADGSLVLFGVGTDCTFGYSWQNSNGFWSEWIPLASDFKAPRSAGNFPAFFALPEGNGVRLWVQNCQPNASSKDEAGYSLLIDDLSSPPTTVTSWEKSVLGNYYQYYPTNFSGVSTASGQFFVSPYSSTIYTYYRQNSAGSWSLKQTNLNSGASVLNPVLATPYNGNSIAVFSGATSSNVAYGCYLTVNGGNVPRTWTNINLKWASENLQTMAASVDNQGRVRLWGLGLSNKIWTMVQDAVGSDTFGAWEQFPTGSLTFKTQGFAVMPVLFAAPNPHHQQVSIWALAADGALYTAGISDAGQNLGWTQEMELPPAAVALQDSLQRCVNERQYAVSNGAAPTWGQYQNAPQIGTARTGVGQNRGEMNAEFSSDLAGSSATSTSEITVQTEVPFNTANWMTEAWTYIRSMPANQFIFPGCHDALTGAPMKYIKQIDTMIGDFREAAAVIDKLTGDAISVPNIPIQQFSSWAVDHSKSLARMLAAGCRFFDLRFSEVDMQLDFDPASLTSLAPLAHLLNHPTNINLNWSTNGFWATHSGAFFDVTPTQVISDLVDALPQDSTELVVINLRFEEHEITQNLVNTFSRFGASSSVNAQSITAAYEKFITDFQSAYRTKYGVNPLVSKNSCSPASTLESLAQSGGRVILIMSENPNVSTGLEEYCWYDQWHNLVNWEDANGDQKVITNAREWLAAVQSRSSPAQNADQFTYLSMTQNSGQSLGHGSMGETTDVLNGPLSDWILYASPRETNSLINVKGPAGITLPYPRHPGGAYHNYNLIGTDFFEKSPLVLNSIVKNLLVARSQYYK